MMSTLAAARCLRRVCAPTVHLLRHRRFLHRTAACTAKSEDISDLVIPVAVRACKNPDDIAVIESFTGQATLDTRQVIAVLTEFSKRRSVRKAAEEAGLNYKLFQKAFISFRTYCLESKSLPTKLHLTLHDILKKAVSADELYPFFLDHAYTVFPHLSCFEELKQASDLSSPENWFPEARNKIRKITYHCGPTNSGKTYAAMRNIVTAGSAAYCAPLRLLAVENYQQLKAEGLPVDLVTGEERIYHRGDCEPAPFVSSTIEMLDSQREFDVCIVDEIQMLGDLQRGFAWTRALLGANTRELHLCGEDSAIPLVENLVFPLGENVEIQKYKRLTPDIELTTPVGSFNNVQDGDCIVCFSKNDIYQVSRTVEEVAGKRVAAIYGTLPPSTKLRQAERFNDPNDPCTVLVATDAIGMGVNLNIRRVVFWSLTKPTLVDPETGEKETMPLSVSKCKQIAGRAGRFGSQYEQGYVTTFRAGDFSTLKRLMSSNVEPVELAGLAPTADQIESFSFLLPEATLVNLIDIFLRIKDVDDDKYFVCATSEIRAAAEAIEHIQLPIRTRYLVARTPVNVAARPFIRTQFVSMIRAFSQNRPVTAVALLRNCGIPLSKTPDSIAQLSQLEDMVDVLDAYLWLSQRFPDIFVDADEIRSAHAKLDDLIFKGILLVCSSVKRAMAKPAQATSKPVPVGETNFNALLKQLKTKHKRHQRVLRKLLLSGQISKDQLEAVISELDKGRKFK